jgi:tRNA-modifying protein YgfZ
MGPVEAPRDELAALLGGRASFRLASRVIRVTGVDAAEWLNDLVTADVATLEPGMARHSLLLTPTGRIRADLTLTRDGQGLIVLQDPAQPDRVDTLLAPYVLSSDVAIRDVSTGSVVFTIGAPATAGDHPVFAPAAFGPGVGALVDAGEARAFASRLEAGGLLSVTGGTVEAWRILRGIPRMGADFDVESLPAEAGLEPAIDRTKGCFLGQESVARIANLGHPPRILRHLHASGDLGAGDPVSAGGEQVGHITSAARDLEDRVVALVRVRWAARDAELDAPGGVRLATAAPD